MYTSLGVRNSVNLGDQIMALASERALMEIGNVILSSSYLDRDTLIMYDLETNEPLKDKEAEKKYMLLFSAWSDGSYMKLTIPRNISPLFLGFHINEVKKDKSYDWLKPFEIKFKSLADYSYLNYYKKSGDKIGCRDPHTQNLFLKNGYDQKMLEVSGCITMLLRRRDPTRKRSGIYICDVSRSEAEKYVPAEILEKAEFITHIYDAKKNITNELDKRREGVKLLDLYENAELVLTSRLHAALPCLAFGTTVLLYAGEEDAIHKQQEDPRFKGLADNVPYFSSKNFEWKDVLKMQNKYTANWYSMLLNQRETIRNWTNKNKQSRKLSFKLF